MRFGGSLVAWTVGIMFCALVGVCLVVLLGAGCNDCGGLWFQDCPTPAPSPSPAPLGTVVASWPSAAEKSLGSVDFKDGEIIEYCQGIAALYFRSIASGEIIRKEDIDGRLTKGWAVAWSKKRNCYWMTNPECEGVDYNLVQLDLAGAVIGGGKMMGGHSTNWIRNYDCDVNEDFTAGPDADGYEITPGDVFVGSLHFSLNKWEYDDVSNPAKYYEAWWFKSDITHRAVTRTGDTFWAAEWGGTRVIEYKFGARKSVAERTGRSFDCGVKFSSLKYDEAEGGRYFWGKGISKATGESRIYQISAGN